MITPYLSCVSAFFILIARCLLLSLQKKYTKTMTEGRPIQMVIINRILSFKDKSKLVHDLFACPAVVDCIQSMVSSIFFLIAFSVAASDQVKVGIVPLFDPPFIDLIIAVHTKCEYILTKLQRRIL